MATTVRQALRERCVGVFLRTSEPLDGVAHVVCWNRRIEIEIDLHHSAVPVFLSVLGAGRSGSFGEGIWRSDPEPGGLSGLLLLSLNLLDDECIERDVSSSWGVLGL